VQSPRPRWSLLGTSTNPHGVTHYTLSCREAASANEDYEELMRVLMGHFDALQEGELLGPYSVHKYLAVDGLRVGMILDEPDSIDLYALDKGDAPAMASFIKMLLEVLNRATAG
jgi:hypothetical protein